jgi:hypothetical protein
MQNAGDHLTDVGFRPEGDAMVLDLAWASGHRWVLRPGGIPAYQPVSFTDR